jgi:hypothetical protein
MDFLEKNIVLLNSPCYETPKKIKIKILEVSNCYLFGAAANVRHFRPFFAISASNRRTARKSERSGFFCLCTGTN